MVMKYIFSKTLWVILFAAFISFLFMLFAGDVLRAHIANWNWVKGRGLLSPSAPLVIHTREEVRVNDSSDIVATINRSKNKVVSVVEVVGGIDQLRGVAGAATSDGLFFTSRAVIGTSKPEALTLVASDGKRYSVQGAVSDPASTVVLLKTSARDFSLVSFASREDTSAGERVMFLGANTDGSPYFLSSFISSSERMPDGVLFSDTANRALFVEEPKGSLPGQGVFDLSGQLVGLWDGQRVVPGSVLQEVVAAALAHSGAVARPAFGFYYRYVSAMSPVPAGLLVVKPLDGKPAVVASASASKAGLLEGDIIIKIGSQEVGGRAIYEELLLGAAPGSSLPLQVWRSGKAVPIEISL